MDANVSNGPWRRFKIQLRKTWNELTDSDLEAISRDRDGLVHVVRRRYCRVRAAAPQFVRISRQDGPAERYLPDSDGLRVRS